MSKIKVLELFAGSRSIGNTAEELGMEVFSVDWTPYEKIDLAIDIEELQKEQIPFIPNIIIMLLNHLLYKILYLKLQ